MSLSSARIVSSARYPSKSSPKLRSKGCSGPRCTPRGPKGRALCLDLHLGSNIGMALSPGLQAASCTLTERFGTLLPACEVASIGFVLQCATPRIRDATRLLQGNDLPCGRRARPGLPGLAGASLALRHPRQRADFLQPARSW